MPNLVERLRDVEKGCRAVLAVIEGVVYYADETMSLFNCGVPWSEAELMVGYEVGIFNQRKEAFEKELFKNLEAMGKRLMGR
jgi:hypothetical protein